MMEMEQELSVDIKKGLWESPVIVSQRTGRKRTDLREGRRNPLSWECRKSRPSVGFNEASPRRTKLFLVHLQSDY